MRKCFIEQRNSRARTNYSALKVFLWTFSATILRPLTSARIYATIATRKSKFERVYNNSKKLR